MKLSKIHHRADVHSSLHNLAVRADVHCSLHNLAVRADVHCSLHNLAVSAKCKSKTAIFVFANKINRH